MNSICYFVAWDDSGCLLGCCHEHTTIREAVQCINCAGAYVLAIENGTLRALTADEELEVKRLRCAPRTDNLDDVRVTPINRPSRRKDETLVEYVSRFLEPYGISQPTLTRNDRSSLVPHVRASGFIGFVLDWLDKWETRELERIFALQAPAWVGELRKRVRRAVKHETNSK